MVRYGWHAIAVLGLALCLAAAACGAADPGAGDDDDVAVQPDGAPAGADAATVPDAGDPEICARIDAPAGQWTWLPVAGARCGRGSPTGFAINPSPTGSRQLVIYLMGGGGCYSAQSCTQGLAAHLDGYDQAVFDTEIGWFPAGSIFDRSSAENPLRDWNWAFVPYCTGDFHSGNRTADYGIQHVGWANFGSFLDRLVPGFCDTEQILLTGSSAGGFGAVFNHDRVARRFPGARVDLADDSGPLMRPAFMPPQTTQEVLRSAWGSAANVPAGCPQCAQEWHNFYPYLAGAWPQARFSLLSSMADQVIGPYFGIDYYTFISGMNDLADQVFAGLGNARVWYHDGNAHVWLSQPLSTTSMGVSLGAFLGAQVGADPVWASVRP